ncbi:MAG: sigma-54-dependent Fis family transcriptional regulator [Bryobacteraceae bacterium]|nr:sigma-54-dependent Fis family transcriptional regulator [Bryobacteraceae bacterium]
MTVLCINFGGEGNGIRAIAESRRDLHLIEVKSVPELLLFVRNATCNVVVISCATPSDRTDDILLEIRRNDRNLPVVFDCDRATTDDVIRLIRLGAHHVWSGDASVDRIHSVLDQAAEAQRETRGQGKPADRNEPWRNTIVGDSDSILRMLDVVRLVAARRSSVLITGETGTGKEVIARALHAAGGRAHLPFVAVNCSAIPANLMESELFGYVKGAFTGAAHSHAGKFEQANGGTIFLDEIGDLPVELQAKLLRVLQEREIQRLGGSETVRLNLRVIAATNADLQSAVQQRTFREDLYYRLNVVPLHVPALRDRRSDIPALVLHFLTKICSAEGVPVKRVTTGAVERLKAYHWPGNVRQLEHAVEMAIVLSGERELLDMTDFRILQSSGLAQARPDSDVLLPKDGLDFEETVSRLEWSLIQQALAVTNGNKARAAELLRMKRTTLLARVRSLEVRREPLVLTACA